MMEAMMARRAPRRAGRRHRPLPGLPAALVVPGICAVLAAVRLWPPAPTPPPAPRALAQVSVAGPLAPGGALNRPFIALSFRAGAGRSPAVPEVEVAVAGRPFRGRAS